MSDIPFLLLVLLLEFVHHDPSIQLQRLGEQPEVVEGAEG